MADGNREQHPHGDKASGPFAEECSWRSFHAVNIEAEAAERGNTEALIARFEREHGPRRKRWALPFSRLFVATLVWAAIAAAVSAFIWL
jgi:hypothetical protein